MALPLTFRSCSRHYRVPVSAQPIAQEPLTESRLIVYAIPVSHERKQEIATEGYYHKGPARRTRTVADAAAELGVSPNQLYMLIRAGKFPHLKVGHRVLVPITVIDRMLDEVA